MTDDWVLQLQRLNSRLRSAFSESQLGNRTQRRQVLTRYVGPIASLKQLSADDLGGVLKGRPLVGVDGSINSIGGHYPYYIDLIRALAKPSQGDSIVLKEIHCPFPPQRGANPEVVLQSDFEVRQQKQADLEVKVALEAIQRFQPSVVLMDGPLVRFVMRTKESFLSLRDMALRDGVLLVGCIENIESQVLGTVLGENLPQGWLNRYDRDLLWGVLEYGEVLKVSRPAKGTVAPDKEADEAEVPIRTWFMRSSLDPGVVGLDMLEEQAAHMDRLADYLFTITPSDGRGIPIWLDLVDREVRLTNAELEAYRELLDPQVKRLFVSKRDARAY